MAIKLNQFVEAGEKFQYKATKTIAYHSIVTVGNLVGVATKAALADEIISCDAVGVYALEKTSGEAITQGAVVYVTTAGKITATAGSNVRAGVAWAAALASDATCLVKLNA